MEDKSQYMIIYRYCVLVNKKSKNLLLNIAHDSYIIVTLHVQTVIFCITGIVNLKRVFTNLVGKHHYLQDLKKLLTFFTKKHKH